MTRPVQSCAQNIDHCSDADRTIHGVLSDNLRERGGTGAAKSVTLHGDTRLAVKQREDGAVAGGKRFATKVGEHIRDNKYKEEPTAQFIEKMVEKFGGMPGKVLSGVKNVSEFHKLAVDWARETGKNQDQALQRDAMNLLVINLIQQELPRAYVASARAAHAPEQTRALYAGVARKFGNLPTARLASVNRELLSSVKAGIAAAQSANLDTPERLEHERNTNRDFAQRYDRETAFRHGVQSVLFQARR
jgi:hypothetical protein